MGIRGCTNSDELDACMLYRIFNVTGKTQAPFFAVGLHQALKAWFENRHLTALQQCSLDDIRFNAQDVVPNVCQDRSLYQANVSGTKHTDIHTRPLSKTD